MEDITIRKTSKSQRTLPKGAKVIDKTVTTSVKEIENGYILCKNIEYKYEYKQDGKTRTDWMYITKEWYSEEDPLEIKITNKDKELADSFDEDDD